MATELLDVKGKAAVVTGGGSGLGLAMAEGLAERGAKVMILDLVLDRAEQEAARLRNDGGDVRAIKLDVSDATAVDAAIDRAATEMNGLDVLFANAGIDPGSHVFGPDGKRTAEGALENYGLGKWRKVIDVSLDGVFHCTRAAVRHMRPRRSGSIIITTSVSSVRAMPIGIAYSAAKAGAAHFMRNAALELAKDGIRVNAIAPGPFVTNIGGGYVQDASVQERMAKMIPLGRLGRTEEIKALALYLASAASAYMTGAELFLDGGLSLGTAID